MQGVKLAQFMERRGRRVFEAAGSLWYGVSPGFMMRVPYQELQAPDADELTDVLQRHRLAGARYPSTSHAGVGSCLYVIRGSAYELNSVHRKHRVRVRHGLEQLTFRQVERDELIAQGRQLNLDTMKRQGRYDSEFGDPAKWKAIVDAAFASPGIATYGMFSHQGLSAYIMTCKEDGWFHLLHQMSLDRDLDLFPNHAISFAVTKMGLEDPDINAVCYGLKALVSTDGLDEYKRRLGFEALPINSCVQLHPMLKPLLTNPVSIGLANAIHRMVPSNQTIEKIGTIMRSAAVHSSGAARITPLATSTDDLHAASQSEGR